jgi:hypothetical protein
VTYLPQTIDAHGVGDGESKSRKGGQEHVGMETDDRPYLDAWRRQKLCVCFL